MQSYTKYLRRQLPNARFWTLINCDWVKLTLKPGEQIHWHISGYHDEGSYWEAEVFEYDQENCLILRGIHSGGTCCDGATERHVELKSRLSAIHAAECCEYQNGTLEPIPGMYKPDWREVRNYQRDRFAESMGY